VYVTCARCGQRGKLLARGMDENCYHRSIHDGTIKNYPTEREDDIPVREPWSWPGDEASLIAKLEAEELTASVVETFEHMRQEKETPGERTVEINRVTFRFHGTQDEMNQKEQETRQRYAKKA